MALKVFIAGQKYFGGQVLRRCLKLGVEVVGVSCPVDDNHIGRIATINEIPRIPAGSLDAESFPEGVDLGISAHSFDYIGKKTRYKARLGWIGYHPSLLPRHRGRSSVEWAIRMRDAITGGSVFWLNQGIDRGDICLQDWCFIDPALYHMNPREAASRLWRNELCPMGEELMEKAIRQIMNGQITKNPQDPRFSTWEPNTDVKDIYRPDALMLPPGKK